jgi:HEPN domain-containing protein
MSLDNLVKTGQLEMVAAQPADIARLLEASQRALNDARTSGLSPESRFDIAYRSIMQAANAALQASGYRTLTSKPGHHMTMIQTLPLTIGLDKVVTVQLDALRKQRNVIDYNGDLVSESMANEAIEQASRLLEKVRENMAGRP